MALPILRESTNKSACTIEQYNADKNPFYVVARGLPYPWPSERRCCSEKVHSLPKEEDEARINHRTKEIIDKYGINWSSIGVHWRHRVGFYGRGIDTWTIFCTGDDTSNYKAAAVEIQQVLISAGIPRNDFNVELTNDHRSYCDESYSIPDDRSLTEVIMEIQPKVLEVVRDHLPKTWTSIAYHMRGKKGCEPNEKKPTVLVFCKPRSTLNWSLVEAKIASVLVSKKHPDVSLHLELLPGQVERATPPFVTHKDDHQPFALVDELTKRPKNESSIGVNTNEEPLTAGTLGGWVQLELPDGRSGKCILTTYDIVRNGDLANTPFNDYNGIGLHGDQPLSPIQVIYPAPMDIEASMVAFDTLRNNEQSLSTEECYKPMLLDQLKKDGIGYVVHASGRRVDPSSRRNLDWALIDSPSTFRRNLAPYFDQSYVNRPWEYKVKEGDFIKSTSSYRPGERVTYSGRAVRGHARIGRIKRLVRWDDGEETSEDELFAEDRQIAACRGDVGSWFVNHKGELVGTLSPMDIWSGMRSRVAFITPIQAIFEDIEKRTGAKISLP